MNQRMCGDIQLVNDGGAVDKSVEMIRRKSDEQNPADFAASSSSAGVSQEEINQLIAELQMKQQIAMGNQQGYGVYPYA